MISQEGTNMKTTSSTAILAMALVTAIAASGCTTAVKEGFGVATGAKGIYAPITSLSASSQARPLGQFRQFELGTMTDNFGGNVPTDLMARLPGAFAEELAKKKLPNEPGGKTLLIRGTILHYEDSGTVGMALGPIEEVLARVELVDKDSGQVLAKANCVGRTTTRVNLGVAKKAEGLAKAIVSWLDKRYPTEGRIE